MRKLSRAFAPCFILPAPIPPSSGLFAVCKHSRTTFECSSVSAAMAATRPGYIWLQYGARICVGSWTLCRIKNLQNRFLNTLKHLYTRYLCINLNNIQLKYDSALHVLCIFPCHITIYNNSYEKYICIYVYRQKQQLKSLIQRLLL